jgi:hypothetical protein
LNTADWLDGRADVLDGHFKEPRIRPFMSGLKRHSSDVSLLDAVTDKEVDEINEHLFLRLDCLANAVRLTPVTSIVGARAKLRMLLDEDADAVGREDTADVLVTTLAGLDRTAGETSQADLKALHNMSAVIEERLQEIRSREPTAADATWLLALVDRLQDDLANGRRIDGFIQEKHR